MYIFASVGSSLDFGTKQFQRLNSDRNILQQQLHAVNWKLDLTEEEHVIVIVGPLWLGNFSLVYSRYPLTPVCLAWVHSARQAVSNPLAWLKLYSGTSSSCIISRLGIFVKYITPVSHSFLRLVTWSWFCLSLTSAACQSADPLWKCTINGAHTAHTTVRTKTQLLMLKFSWPCWRVRHSESCTTTAKFVSDSTNN